MFNAEPKSSGRMEKPLKDDLKIMAGSLPLKDFIQGSDTLLGPHTPVTLLPLQNQPPQHAQNPLPAGRGQVS